jgi:hypothetical protein
MGTGKEEHREEQKENFQQENKEMNMGKQEESSEKRREEQMWEKQTLEEKQGNGRRKIHPGSRGGDVVIHWVM